MDLEKLPKDLQEKVNNYQFELTDRPFIRFYLGGSIQLDGDFRMKDLQFLIDILEDWKMHL